MPNRNYFSGSDIVSQHWVIFNVESNRTVYVLTGVFLTGLKGESQNWLRERIFLNIPIPALPMDKGLHIEYWAPYFTMNSVYNRDTAVNSGHAVDAFGIQDREGDSNFGQNSVTFFADTAERDSDAYLYRIGFNVTLKGTLKPIRPVIIL
ncbi:MAG: hypothetical protein M3Z92_08735 [Bacteroidota bacterium]|nr:hypothetical protein [Bacteroidota bacterium]